MLADDSGAQMERRRVGVFKGGSSSSASSEYLRAIAFHSVQSGVQGYLLNSEYYDTKYYCCKQAGSARHRTLKERNTT